MPDCPAIGNDEGAYFGKDTHMDGSVECYWYDGDDNFQGDCNCPGEEELEYCDVHPENETCWSDEKLDSYYDTLARADQAFEILDEDDDDNVDYTEFAKVIFICEELEVLDREGAE